ncbi:unnamed protein product [Cunninghamella blakesleeana]
MKIIAFFIISSSLIFGSSIAVRMPPRAFMQCMDHGFRGILCYGGRSSNKNDAITYKDIYQMAPSTSNSFGDDSSRFEGLTPDQMANSWNDLREELPFPNSDFLLPSAGNTRFIMIGGSGSVGNSSSPVDLDKDKSTSSLTVTIHSNINFPPLRGSAFAMDNATDGMIAGGATYGNTSSFYTDVVKTQFTYKTRILSITKVGTINTNRFGHAMIYKNNVLYIIGGQQLVNNQLQSIPMNQMTRFDTLQSAWTTVNCKGPIPTSRSYFTLTKSVDAYYPNGYILFGGINADTNVVSTDTMYVLYFDSGTYETLNTINGPSPRYGHSALVHRNVELFIINGMDTTGAALSDFKIFDIPGNQWVDKFSTYGSYPDSPYKKHVPMYNSELQSIAWGITIAVIVFIQLVGFGLHKYVDKNASHHETNVESLDNKESDQNYQHQSSSPIQQSLNDRPLPPAPRISMPTGPEYNSSSPAIFYQQDVPYSQRQ